MTVTKIARGRGRPRQFDKEAALDAALRLFWRHGFEGSSIAALAESMKVTVPSLYLAFGNKESLFMQSVEHYCRQYSAGMYVRAFEQPTAREVACTILSGEVDLVSGPETPEGCLMVQGALATGPGAEAVQQVMSQLRRQAQADVAKRFERARRARELPIGWKPETLAAYLMTVTAGMAVQAKGGASRPELLRVAEMAMHIWPPEAVA